MYFLSNCVTFVK